MFLLKIIPDTYRTVQEELYLLGGAVLLGIPSGIFFDFLRFFRRIIRHHFLTVMLEDIIFLVFSSFLLLSYISAFAEGEFRMYLVIGWLCGFLLHECTLGSFILHIWDSFARICKKILSSFVKHAKK